jgi:hypothetical protein
MEGDVGLDLDDKLQRHFFASGGPTRFLAWSPEPDLNRRPRPYQGRALPTELSGQTKTLAKKRKRVKNVTFAIWAVNSKLAKKPPAVKTARHQEPSAEEKPENHGPIRIR